MPQLRQVRGRQSLPLDPRHLAGRPVRVLVVSLSSHPLSAALRLTLSRVSVSPRPQKSSLLQMCVSIQGLVLIREPYFNEPGFEKMRGTEEATINSVRLLPRSRPYALIADRDSHAPSAAILREGLGPHAGLRSARPSAPDRLLRGRDPTLLPDSRQAGRHPRRRATTSRAQRARTRGWPAARLGRGRRRREAHEGRHASSQGSYLFSACDDLTLTLRLPLQRTLDALQAIQDAATAEKTPRP